MRPAGPSVLQVFPDDVRLEEALRQAALCPDGHLPAGLTWDGLGAALASPATARSGLCTPLVGRALLARVAAALEGSPWGEAVGEPAFVRAALDCLFEVKVAGLDPPTLGAVVAAALPAGRPAHGLARLLQGYDEALAAHHLVDAEDVRRGARAALERGAWPATWAHLEAVVLHGMHEAPPSVLALLWALARACQARGVRLQVRAPAGAAVSALLARGGRAPPGVVLEEPPPGQDAPLAALGRSLFAPGVPAGALRQEAAGLEVWCAASALGEARLVARAVRARVEAGVAPERIAVAWRAPGVEVRWVAEALEELGVAARPSQGEPLVHAPAVRLALDLPLLVEDGFPAERVAELLSSCHAAALSAGSAGAPAALLAAAGVRDDRLGASASAGAYEVRLEAYARRLGNGRERMRAFAARQIRERCARLFGLCRDIPAQGRAGHLLEAWWHAARAVGLTDSSGPLALAAAGGLMLPALHARARDDAAREALQARVEELSEATRLAGGGPHLSRRAFARWLADALHDVSLPPPPGGPRAVALLDVRELGGRAFEHVFLAGLTQGRFPAPPERQPLLSDADRLALNRHLGREAFTLRGSDADGHAVPLAERLLLGAALGAAHGGASLSYALEGADGREQVASRLLEEVQRLAGCACVPRALAPVPPLEGVLSEAELRQRAALEVLAVPPAAPDVREALLHHLGREDWLAAAQARAEMEAERARFFSGAPGEPGPFSGAVDAPDVRAHLDALFRFGPERPLSASALARFGACAFRGFVQYALRLPEPQEAGEEMDPRVRGTFWHLLLEELFGRLGARGWPAHAPDGEVLDAVLDEALQVAVEGTEARGHVGHPALWRLARERARAMARRLLEAGTRGVPFAGAAPRAHELKFGPAGTEGWTGVVLGSGEDAIHFEGKIDRLDALDGQVAVVDYKSGHLEKAPGLRERLLSTDFQLPLYLFAARASGHPGAKHAAWVALGTGEATYLSDLLSEAELEDLLSTEPQVRARVSEAGGLNLANAVEALVRALRAGHFPPRPRECGRCGYRTVCRLPEERP
jgi:RecB family exonuclease